LAASLFLQIEGWGFSHLKGRDSYASPNVIGGGGRLRPRERRREKAVEQDLFRSRLDQVIQHGITRWRSLARTIRLVFWKEEVRGAVYADGLPGGRPAAAAADGGGWRILKHTYTPQATKAVCEAVDREPVFTNLSAARNFFPAPALDARSLLDGTHWRNGIGRMSGLQGAVAGEAPGRVATRKKPAALAAFGNSRARSCSTPRWQPKKHHYFPTDAQAVNRAA